MTGSTDHFQPVGSPLLGIDVYNGDGPIRWDKLIGSGRYFAWIKATEGGDFRDASFKVNRDGARANNVICGAYHFFRPKTAVQAQIDNFCEAVGAMRSGELPPALDLEVPEQWKGASELRQQQLAEWQEFAMEDRVKKVLQWCEAVENQLGMRPCLYASPSFIDQILGNDKRLAKYRLWLAHYTETPRVPAPWTNYTWHQYNEHGSIPEVTSHELDLNRFDGSLEELKSLCFGAQVRDEQSSAPGSKPWYGNCPFIRWLIGLFGR